MKVKLLYEKLIKKYFTNEGKIPKMPVTPPKNQHTLYRERRIGKNVRYRSNSVYVIRVKPLYVSRIVIEAYLREAELSHFV